MPKIRGSRDRRDWAGVEGHNLRGRRLPEAPGWNPDHMDGEALVAWAEWAGVRFQLVEGDLRVSWNGPRPFRTLEILKPYREEIKRYLEERNQQREAS